MKKFNISKPKKYTDKNTGEERTFWQNIGTMTVFDKPDGTSSMIMEIPAIGLEANIFPMKPREPQPQQQAQAPQQSTTPQQPAQGQEEIQVKDLPF